MPRDLLSHFHYSCSALVPSSAERKVGCSQKIQGSIALQQQIHVRCILQYSWHDSK